MRIGYRTLEMAAKGLALDGGKEKIEKEEIF